MVDAVINATDLRRGDLLLRYLTSHHWVHRRVERIDFLDDRTLRRHVSVDFSLPPPGSSADDLVAPLTLLRKQPLIDFDLRDSTGKPLALLTTWENGHLAFCVLAAAARRILEPEGKLASLPAVLNDLAAVANEPTSVAVQVVEDWVDRSEDDDVRTLLMNHRDNEGRFIFADLMYELATNFVLIPVLTNQNTARTIVKFSYVESFPADDSVPLGETDPDDERGRLARWVRRLEVPLHDLASTLGWAATPMVIDTPGVSRGGSYHLEVRSPRGLSLVGGFSIAWNEDDDLDFGDVRVTPGYMHSHLSSRRSAVGGQAFAFLRPERTGLLRIGVITSLLTFAALCLLTPILESLERPGQSAASVLLVIPGLVSAYISRPGENLLASALLLGVRFLVAVSGLTAYLGAFFLLVRDNDKGLPGLWLALLVCAFVCFLSLLITYARARVSPVSDTVS